MMFIKVTNAKSRQVHKIKKVFYGGLNRASEAEAACGFHAFAFE